MIITFTHNDEEFRISTELSYNATDNEYTITVYDSYGDIWFDIKLMSYPDSGLMTSAIDTIIDIAKRKININTALGRERK